MGVIEKLLFKYFGGHVSFRRLTLYGYNAMHFALNFRTKRWGYVCFHPTIRCFGRWWPWYFYLSPNATPWAATFAIGPGVDANNKQKAPIRKHLFGHGFDTEAHRDLLYDLNYNYTEAHSSPMQARRGI